MDMAFDERTNSAAGWLAARTNEPSEGGRVFCWQLPLQSCNASPVKITVVGGTTLGRS